MSAKYLPLLFSISQWYTNITYNIYSTILIIIIMSKTIVAELKRRNIVVQYCCTILLYNIVIPIKH